MEPFDLNTRLPPRKRLLAGMKMVSPSCDLDLPLPLASSDLGARLRGVVSSETSSPEEIAEAAKSVALAAAEVAAAARSTAMQKAAVAAKARAAAKTALELLDSISRNEAPHNDRRSKPKLRKRHVPIKLLYKANRPLERRQTDEELARKLHHAMNSSPRILKKPPVNAKEETSGGGSIIDGSNVVQPSNGNVVDKPENETVVYSKADILEEESSSYCSRKRLHLLEPGGNSGGRKAKIKRKKLLLSECCSRTPEEPKQVSPSAECIVTKEIRTPVHDLKTSNVDPVKFKITSMWKSNKLNTSQCSSDSKILHAICSGPSAAKTSAVVKVD